MNPYEVCFVRGMLDAARDEPCPYEYGTRQWNAWLDGKIAYENPDQQED